MALKKYPFDVAFSLLHQDLPFVQEVFDALSKYKLSTFLYPHNQKELANKNGIAVFSNTFKKDARVVVLFYRTGYGDTYWTGIEHTAIQERYLKEGAEFCILVRMDKAKPIWYPEFMQYTSPSMKPEQIAELILKKIEDMGGNLKEKTFEEYLDEANEIKERKRLHYHNLEQLSGDIFDEEVKKLRAEVQKTYNIISDKINYLNHQIRGIQGNSMQINVSNVAICFEIHPINQRVINANSQTYTLKVLFKKNTNGNTGIVLQVDYKINQLNEKGIGWTKIKYLSDNTPPYYHKIHDYVTGKAYEFESRIFTTEELVRQHATDFIKWVLDTHPL